MENLEKLFYPATIALLGASQDLENVGHFFLSNLIKSGYSGRILPVNTDVDEILGVSCIASLTQIKEKIDLSIIALPKTEVKKAALQSMEAGAKAIVIVSGGFREAGNEGAQLEEQIVAMCALRGVRILGPNCLGLINTDHAMNALAGNHMPGSGGISMISQSSSLCSLFLDNIKECDLGVAKIVNFGNKADLSEIEMLRYLAHDKQTKVIVGYLESISSGDEFVKAAEDASANKPIIMLQGATTESGRKAVAAHSGIDLGTGIAYVAAFSRAGVVRADTYGALFDLAAAFSLQPLPKGKRVLVITNSGAPGIMAVDAIERAGLEAAYLQEKNNKALSDILPEAATVFNPIDLLADADGLRYEAVLKAAYADEKIDAIIVVMVARISSNPFEIAQAIIKNSQKTKPIFVSFIGGTEAQKAKKLFMPQGIPDYRSPEHAVSAIKAMWEYVQWTKRPPRVVTRFRVHRRRVERIISRRIRSNRLHIGEVKAKDILRAYDFQIPEGYLATSPEEALEIADRIGYPVALKIVSSDIGHKTDLGGVKLNISNKMEVRDSYELMMLRIHQRLPKAVIDGIYVEKMLDRGLEVILGMNRDPQFGPMLMFGLGGIFVETMADVAFHLAPITFDEAIKMLTSTRSYEILVGARGEEGVDIEIIAKSLQRLSQLATDFPQIAEIDINPLIFAEFGADPYVANARITLKASA